jgi:HK97 family phage major capsid protein
MDNFDFSGYATKNDLKCTDGRVIRHDAFKKNHGIRVPLVWQHLHNDPENILGYALLENRPDGVYAYGKFNDTPKGRLTKTQVQHGDITFLSIYANQLEQVGKDVMHGMIREVSLVVAGANPGATIDNLQISHADGSDDTEDVEEAVIFTGELIDLPETKQPEVKEPEKMADVVKHADAAPAASEKTVGEIFDTLTEEQKTVVYALIAEVADATAAGGDMSQSDDEEGDDKVMKHNVFEGEKGKAMESLSHAQFDEIVLGAKQIGSFKQSFLAHVQTYGIEDIEFLFPDAQTIDNTPAMLSRRMEWVTGVINGTNHSPFSRIKTIVADITADEARAKGYVKGSLKKDEIIKLLKRVTTPKTIYKKQKLDRDDVVDITGIDVIAWMKAEMRVMLDEELARAILIGDGRDSADEDKIDEDHLRPVWTDDDMYSHHVRLEADATTDDKIEAIIRARAQYKGSGSPALYCSSDFVSDMLLLKDTLGRRIYGTEAELAAVLRVSKIVEVPVMTDLTRDSSDDVPVELNLVAIIVNLKDYTLGADKGGAVSMFDDFDIDYNQFKYLIETRVSGALTLPKSALVIEQEGAAG